MDIHYEFIPQLPSKAQFRVQLLVGGEVIEKISAQGKRDYLEQWLKSAPVPSAPVSGEDTQTIINYPVSILVKETVGNMAEARRIGRWWGNVFCNHFSNSEYLVTAAPIVCVMKTKPMPKALMDYTAGRMREFAKTTDYAANKYQLRTIIGFEDNAFTMKVFGGLGAHCYLMDHFKDLTTRHSREYPAGAIYKQPSDPVLLLDNLILFRHRCLMATLKKESKKIIKKSKI